MSFVSPSSHVSQEVSAYSQEKHQNFADLSQSPSEFENVWNFLNSEFENVWTLLNFPLLDIKSISMDHRPCHSGTADSCKKGDLSIDSSKVK